MIISVEDKSYRCKDCDSFGQCKYYNNRRSTSHICKEFTNDSKVAEILADIKAKIQEKSVWYRGQTYDGLCIALEIINNIGKAESEE